MLSLSFSLSHTQSSPEPEDAVIKTVVARFGYTPQYDDELGFSAGDHIDVTVDSKSLSIHKPHIPCKSCQF